MGTYIETGHTKNVANFDHLITFIQSYGANYSPSNSSITLANLQIASTNGQTALTNVKNEFNSWKNATNSREIAFEPLKGLATQLLNTLIAIGANEQTIKDFKTINAKVQGSKLTKADAGIADDSSTARADGSKLTKADSGITDESTAKMAMPSKKSISASQQSYDNLIDHYDKLIKLLASVPTYTPTENSLKVATLNTMLTNLKAANTLAYNKVVSVSNARIARNKVLYENPDALVTLAKLVKAYIKGKFGAKSPEFAQVSALKFTMIKAGK